VKFDLVHAHSPFFVGKFALAAGPAQRNSHRGDVPLEIPGQLRARGPIPRSWTGGSTRSSTSTRRSTKSGSHGSEPGHASAVRVPRSVQVVQNGVDLEPPARKESCGRRRAVSGDPPCGTFSSCTSASLPGEEPRAPGRSLAAARRRGRGFAWLSWGKDIRRRVEAHGGQAGPFRPRGLHGVVRDRVALSACLCPGRLLPFPSRYDTNGMDGDRGRPLSGCRHCSRRARCRRRRWRTASRLSGRGLREALFAKLLWLFFTRPPGCGVQGWAGARGSLYRSCTRAWRGAGQVHPPGSKRDKNKRGARGSLPCRSRASLLQGKTAMSPPYASDGCCS